MLKKSNLVDDDSNSDNIVTVYNLPSIYDESDVTALFANVGTVLGCSIKNDESKSHNIAIIKFSSQKEADLAVELSGVSVRYHILGIIKGRPPVIANNESNDIETTISKVKEIRDKITAKLTSKPSEDSSTSVEPIPSDEKTEQIKSTSGSKGGYKRGRSSRSHSRDKSRRRYSRYRRSRSRSRRLHRRSYSRSSSRSSTYSSSSGYSSRSSYRSDTDSSDYSHRRYGRSRRYRSRSRSRSKRRHAGGSRYRK